jgi:AraC family transcriptional activator FtrA
MSPHRVVALVHPPQSPFELSCASEVFGLDRPGLAARYEFQVCTLRPGPVPTLGGYAITATRGLSALRRADTIVIPGWHAEDVPAPVLQALRDAHRRSTRILAICFGAFVLAAAGLLDGRRATTHWRGAAELTRRYPQVRVDADVLYVDHGDVATSAGTAAGIDLCLHVVRTDHGAAYAAEIARHMVMPPRREGGQVQYARPAPERARDASLAAVLDWAVGQLGRPITVTDLARRARLSPRTLARRFTEQVGTSPGQWILAKRLDAARELLESTDLPVETVAARVGLSSAVNLRHHFHARLATTPAAYRRTFGTQP